MALIDDDSWLLEFSGLERLAHQISLQISERDSRNSSKGLNFLINALVKITSIIHHEFFRIQ